MAVLFPKSYQVIRRGVGSYINGVWTPAPEEGSETLLANIHPASSADYERAQATLAGRRITAMKRCFTNIGANLRVAGGDGYPGDIVIYQGQRWLVIGSADWNSLGDADTSHMRYILALEAERGDGEVTA